MQVYAGANSCTYSIGAAHGLAEQSAPLGLIRQPAEQRLVVHGLKGDLPRSHTLWQLGKGWGCLKMPAQHLPHSWVSTLHQPTGRSSSDGQVL